MNSSLRLALSLALCLTSSGLTPSAARTASRLGKLGYAPASSVLGTTMPPRTISSHQIYLKSSGRVLLPTASQPALLQFPTAAKGSPIADSLSPDTKAALLELLTDEFMAELMLEESHTMACQQSHKEQESTLAEKLKSKKEQLKQAARKRAQEYLENYLKEIREKPLEVWEKAERMKKEKSAAKLRLKEQIAQLLLKRGGFAGLYFGSRLAPKTSSTAQPQAPEPMLKPVVESVD